MTYALIAIIVLAAVAAVAWPFLQRGRADIGKLDDAAIEHRITSYRAALKADSVCDRCLRDNPTDARYCADCGNMLREAEGARSNDA